MSVRQAAETSITKAQLFTYLVTHPEAVLQWGQADATGTRAVVTDRGVEKLFLVTDLPAPSKASSTHGHTPDSFPNLATPGWIDPFATSSITPVVLTGLTETLTARTAAQGLQLVMMAAVTAKVSAGTGFIDIFIDGITQGIGAQVISVTYTTVPVFLMAPNVFADALPHTIDLRAYVDLGIHTFNALGLGANGSIISYLSAVDLGTTVPIG